MKNFKRTAICIFFLFIFIYGYISIKLDISFYDEFLWIGRSHFFSTYIQGDFRNPIWQTFESYDQPKLAEYMYGAWLYPLYLIEHSQNKAETYMHFLINHSLYIDRNYDKDYFLLPQFNSYINSRIHKMIFFNKSDQGDKNYFLQKYGQTVNLTLSIIYYARLINVLLLSATMVIVYSLALFFLKKVHAIIFTILFGCNYLVIGTTLMAHSEGLFIFLFLLGIYLLLQWRFHNKSKKYLFLFSIVCGLCMSTKLNGSMLLFICYIFYLTDMIFKQTKLMFSIKSLMISMLVVITVFIILNPYVFSNPLNNIRHLFEHRKNVALYQSMAFPRDDLSDPEARAITFFKHFYFPHNTINFNTLFFIPNIPIIVNQLLFVLSLVGFFTKIKERNKYIPFLYICSILIMSMTFAYLIIDWWRYYIQVIFFIYIFEFAGFYYICNFVRITTQNLSKKTNSIYKRSKIESK